MSAKEILDDIFKENGISGLAITDDHPMDSWESIRVAGEKFPRLQLRAVRTVESGRFFLQDETGWDGYQEVEDRVITGYDFATYEEARSVLSDVMDLARKEIL